MRVYFERKKPRIRIDRILLLTCLGLCSAKWIETIKRKYEIYKMRREIDRIIRKQKKR